MTNEEEWRPVSGYEGKYEVSDQGRVRSLDRYVTNCPPTEYVRLFRGRVLKARINTVGYWRVVLYRTGQPAWTVAIHTLVLTAFSGPRPEGNVARHLNGMPLDNRAVNLKWGTAEENMQDAIRHGTNRNARKTHCIHGHEFSGYNLRFDPATGRRVCRACVRDAQRRRQRRLAGAER